MRNAGCSSPRKRKALVEAQQATSREGELMTPAEDRNRQGGSWSLLDTIRTDLQKNQPQNARGISWHSVIIKKGILWWIER